jgi:hypothetical protein
MESLADSDYVTNRRNNMILVVTDDNTMAHIVEDLHALRERLGHGLRGIVTHAEEVI